MSKPWRDNTPLLQALLVELSDLLMPDNERPRTPISNIEGVLQDVRPQSGGMNPGPPAAIAHEVIAKVQISKLRKAIEDKGPCPEFHREIMRRHRAEWPALWRAIDALLAQD